MMKRAIVAVVLVCVMSSGAFAVSEDMSVYVRQDVFDAKMETLFLRLHSEIENLGTRLEGKIETLSERIDGLDKRIDGLDKRIDGLNTFIYYLLVLFGTIFLIPSISKFWEWQKEIRKPVIPLDDVQRIVREAISENIARIQKAGA